MKSGTSKVWGTLFPELSRTLAAALALALLVAAAHAQVKKPISRTGLVNAVRINGLSTAELIGEIRARGVAFEMTPDAEAELRSVGARPEVIEAARSNYRAPAVAAAPATMTKAEKLGVSGSEKTGAKSSAKSSAPVPPGPALSKNEIITMLQGGIASARVEQFVEARGVTFAVTPEITSEIKAAGGDRSLIGAITEKSAGDAASNTKSGGDDSPFVGKVPDSKGGSDYDDYMDRISSSWSAQDWNSAIRYAQQAVQLDPTRPQAYQYLGTMLLYTRNDFAGAEQAMRAAIERGGSAAFHVYHDHTGNFSDYCEGTLFVSKAGVTFRANNGADTFEAEDSNIKEAKTNGWVGMELGAFHIKPVQKINGRDNFNFAPNTRNRAESQMIINLIKAY